jgi:hypothetical protein
MADAAPLSRTVEYRRQVMTIVRLPKQWQVEIAPTPGFPDPEILKGWDESELFERAKRRIDDRLEQRHP